MNLYIDTILEYIDTPQLFIARDDFDALFLCLAYDDDKYTGIRISGTKMREFEERKCDLHSLFLNPENPCEYFEVTSDQDGNLRACAISEIDASRLPEPGYYLSEPLHEKITVTIPSKDKSLFSSIIKRFGWVAM